MIIYIDMDGVIARWNSHATEEDTHKEGYFSGREPEPVILALMDRLKEKGIRTEILTAAYQEGTARRDKLAWLKAQGLDWVKVHFVPYGERKTDYVDKSGSSVLIDDYSRNLHDWESAGMTGIKFYNGINGRHGSWKGRSIRHTMNIDEMMAVIEEGRS